MANNPYVNKVQKADGTTIMDITDTTATAGDVLSGEVFYTASGTRSVGSLSISDKADKVSGATGGNFASLTSIEGNLADSGYRANSFIVKTGETTQWINSGTGSTALGIANNINGNAASLKADSEGGNVSLAKDSKYVELDTYGLQTDGSGYARIVVDNASSYKTFKLQQDGNFVDGNNVSTGGLNRDKLNSSSIAITQTTDNATQNIEKGQFVVWHGSPCTASSAISSGDALSSSNLSSVTNGLFNLLHKAFITEEYTYSYNGLADGGYKAVSASDLGISAKQGYTLAGFIGFASGSYNIYVYGVMPNTSGIVLSLRNKSGTSVTTTVTCKVVGLWIKNELL